MYVMRIAFGMRGSTLMSCYHPSKGLVIGINGEGKKVIKIVPYDSIDTVDNQGKEYESFLVPCGHCIGCRSDQAREWSNRLLMESLYHDETYFLTLTYDDEHINWCDWIDPNKGEVWYADEKRQATLSKRDFQLFIKRLRKEFSDDRIRYYLVGEYGGRTNRPHGHAIIFGLHIPWFEMIPCGRSETGDRYYVNERIQKCWSLGFTSIEPANEYTIKYVTGYVTKKLGAHPDSFYAAQGIVAPFALMSRKPGIGVQYLLDNPNCVENDNIVISTAIGKSEFMPPKIFRRKVKDDFPEIIEELSKKHLKLQNDRINAELNATDLNYKELNKIKENNHLNSRKNRNKI